MLLLALLGLGASAALAREEHRESAARQERPSLVLLTLDTTRADHVGSSRSAASLTPVLDALAATGVRYVRALTPSPLTLPAHASIMTGLEPPEHGVRDNGIAALSAEIPTLAGALSERGFATVAFVASRVLDRRFGLDRGFDVYDDRMTAERLGEYGYPERDARAVTSAAISWLESVPAERPFFLWVHYYDPHAPYDPPRSSRSGTSGYAGEVSFVDSEIGRLLGALPAQSRGRVVAVVGDHGESLGEHGERSHGIFLYGSSLDVPLIIAGRGVPEQRVVDSPVSIKRLPATLLELLDPSSDPPLPGPVLPGILAAQAEATPTPIYSETRMPATAYGWAPLRAVSDRRWRLIKAPELELYDLIADPGETRNLAAARPEQTRRLLRTLKQLEQAMTRRQEIAAEQDPDLDVALRGLGYLDSGGEAGSIDPKDGIRWLEEFEQAKLLAASGHHLAARARLEALVDRNPDNVPFLTHLADAQLETGATEAAITTYTRALDLNPELEFLHLGLARAYGRLGRADDARREYEAVLRLDPRSSAAWLELAEAAHDAGQADRELSLLNRAVETGTTSAVVHYRLGQIASGAADLAAAERHFGRAIELIPGWPAPLLGLARVLRARGESVEARRLLRQILKLAPESSAAVEARKLLAVN